MPAIDMLAISCAILDLLLLDPCATKSSKSESEPEPEPESCATRSSSCRACCCGSANCDAACCDACVREVRHEARCAASGQSKGSGAGMMVRRENRRRRIPTSDPMCVLGRGASACCWHTCSCSLGWAARAREGKRHTAASDVDGKGGHTEPSGSWWT